MLKCLITDYKKIKLYGDCHVHEKGFTYYFRGRMIRVKILGLFWIKYKGYEI
jgi:hypothetical protein